MRDAALLERLLRRDTRIVSTALAVISGLAWWYVIRLARDMDMGGMDMSGWRMASTGFGMVMAPAHVPWSRGEFVLMFAMWAVMMVGMMTPSAAPLVLLYGRVGRRAAAEGTPMAATGWFAGGYLAAWTLFALVATIAQWALDRAALLSAMMAAVSRPFGGAVLVLAGLYQWSRLKDVCLAHCQTPIHFLQRHGGFRRDVRGSFALGAHHGVYCVGCCWSLMALLFVGGVMSLTWIAGLSILVLLEKILPAGRVLARTAGAILVAGGVWWSLSGP